MPLLILRYGDNQPEDYPTTRAAEYFAQLVEERTQGRICVRLYCNGELGDEYQVFEQVQFGGIDMAWVSLGTLAEYHPEIEDLQGLSIRDQESTLMSRMVELLGAKPVQIPYNDVYSALQTSKIDGAENNWPSYAATGHYQTARYYLLDEHSRLPEMQIMSTVALDKISEIDEDYVTIIRQCALYERELWLQEEETAEGLARDYGCAVTTLSENELEKFRRAVQSMYEEYPKEQQALIQQIRDS